jgi:hypothetical protein
MTDDSLLFHRADGLLVEEEDDDAVVVRLGDDRWAILDGTARALWDLLDQPRPMTDIVIRLAAAYRGRLEIIATDVADTLTRWREHGMVAVGVTDP